MESLNKITIKENLWDIELENKEVIKMTDNKEGKNFRSASINCEEPIHINIYSNHWKYWFFNVEIFTYIY